MPKPKKPRRPYRPSGGLIYWQRYAADHGLGKPVAIREHPHSYTIVWPERAVETPFFGTITARKKLISDVKMWIRNVGEQATGRVRVYLREHASLSGEAAQALEDQLPIEWKKLIWKHGQRKVFDCLRSDMTLGGAMRALL